MRSSFFSVTLLRGSIKHGRNLNHAMQSVKLSTCQLQLLVQKVWNKNRRKFMRQQKSQITRLPLNAYSNYGNEHVSHDNCFHVIIQTQSLLFTKDSVSPDGYNYMVIFIFMAERVLLMLWNLSKSEVWCVCNSSNLLNLQYIWLLPIQFVIWHALIP